MPEFANVRTGFVSMKVNLNAAGNIAQSGETAVGNKTISIPGIASDVTLAKANQVFSAIVGNICGGAFDSLTAEQTIKRKVVG